MFEADVLEHLVTAWHKEAQSPKTAPDCEGLAAGLVGESVDFATSEAHVLEHLAAVWRKEAHVPILATDCEA